LVRWMASYTLSAWLPVFYRRVFGLSPATIATYLSLIYLFSGFGGSLIGSGIANFWAKVCIHVCSMWYGSDVNRLSLSLSLSLSFLLAHCVCVCAQHNTFGRVWLCLISGLLAIPFMVGVFFVQSYSTSLVCLAVAFFFAEMWSGPALTTVSVCALH
jgi:hypothetical protein